MIVFGLDPWLRHSAVQTLQSATGAKVDIGSFSTGLFPPQLSLRNVALASASSPGTNVLEFGELRCRLGGHPLLRKSFVIEEASLTGLRLRTVRNDDGQLDVTPETESREPSWLTEKLSEAGDEWLDELIIDVREQLDPNTLETWRTGQTLSVKWEGQSELLRQELNSFKPRVELLQDELKKARKLPSVARVQRYLELASEGEQLLSEIKQLQVRIQALVPKAQTDLAMLDQARWNDQQLVVQKIHQLNPSPRRITESLIGREMYRQLHQVLTWLQFASNYRNEVRRQTTVVRHRGHDIQFPLMNPTPRFLCRHIGFSGELSMDQQLMPFRAVLSDVSSNPVLTGRPSVFQLSTEGEQLLKLAVRQDNTTDNAQTDVVAKYRPGRPRRLRVGREETAVLEAELVNLDWKIRIQLSGTNVRGIVRVDSDLQHTNLTSRKMKPQLQSAVRDVFDSVKSVDATVQIAGTLDAPAVEIGSRFADGVVSGLQTAFARQAEQLKSELRSHVKQLAIEQQERLSAQLSRSYEQLVVDHQETLQQIQGTQQVLVSLRSGQTKPTELFRQVSEAGILPRKKGKKIQRQMDQTEKLLQEFGGGIFR